jgi:hypothetical protein
VVAGVLEPAEDEQADQVADVEAVGGGVAPVVERDGFWTGDALQLGA